MSAYSFMASHCGWNSVVRQFGYSAHTCEFQKFEFLLTTAWNQFNLIKQNVMFETKIVPVRKQLWISFVKFKFLNVNLEGTHTSALSTSDHM